MTPVSAFGTRFAGSRRSFLPRSGRSFLPSRAVVVVRRLSVCTRQLCDRCSGESGPATLGRVRHRPGSVGRCRMVTDVNAAEIVTGFGEIFHHDVEYLRPFDLLRGKYLPHLIGAPDSRGQIADRSDENFLGREADMLSE